MISLLFINPEDLKERERERERKRRGIEKEGENYNTL